MIYEKVIIHSFNFFSLLVGCKGGPGDTPDVPEEFDDVPEEFDIDKINFDYKMGEGYEEYKGLELYKKISNDKDHYLFYIFNHIDSFPYPIQIYYGCNQVGGTGLNHFDYFFYKLGDKISEVEKKYFNSELNVEEPETFKDYTYEFEVLGNKIHLIFLPALRNPFEFDYNKFVESDDYPVYYSDDEKDIHIGFTFKEGLLEPNCINGVYNFTDLTNKMNAKYCIPLSLGKDNFFDIFSFLNYYENSDNEKKFIKEIIGLDYTDIGKFRDDYKLFEDLLEQNLVIDDFLDRFHNPDFNEEHYNLLKNHGTAFNISFDKLSIKYCYKYSYGNETTVGLTVKVNNVELYELNNEKYVPTELPLTKNEYPDLYQNLFEKDINIPIRGFYFSPYENKIIGYYYTEYCY